MTTTEESRADGTASVRARAALAAAGLADHDRTLRPLRAGWGSNELWRVGERADRALVLRVFPGPVYGSRGRPAAEREAAAHAAAHAAGVPTPAVHRVVDVAVPGEAPSVAMVTALAPGVTLAERLLEHPEEAYELGAQCGAVLARLGRVSAPAVVAERSWRDWPAADPLGDAVRERLPADVGESLLHLDLHPENVLVTASGRGPRVSAVLDWANARSGPAEADLARSLAILDLVRERPDPIVGAGTIDAYAGGLIDGSGGRSPAPEYRWWALACQINDLAPIAARSDGWLRPTDLAAWRRRLGRAMELPTGADPGGSGTGS